MGVIIVECDDCKIRSFENYMIKHELWLSVAENYNLLCLPCFEKQLGRKVTLYDLHPCQLTYTAFLGAYVASNTPNPPSEETLLRPVKNVEDNRRFLRY